MTNKKLLLTCIVSFLLLSITLIYTVNYHINHNTVKAATKHHTAHKIIKETFIIKSVEVGNYSAINARKGTDKTTLLFDQSNMKTPVQLNVGDKVTAYYTSLKGEDEFLYALKIIK